MTYDEARGEVVLFGGYGPAGNNSQRTDTWVWDGTAWTQRTPSVNPGYCPAAEMTYDAPRAVVVLFCGYNGLNPGATWTWDGTTWLRQAPLTTPSPRQHYAFTYDAARGEVVLFGGRSNNGGYLADTWVWTGRDWVQRAPATSPSRRTGIATYDKARRAVVLFGGTGDTGTLTDTWTWDGVTWTESKPLTSPPGRSSSMLAYDSSRGLVLLFGGADPRSSTPRDDTWSWDGAAWAQIATATSPPGRYGAGFAFHAASSQAVLFGGAVANGFGGFAPADDTWTLDSFLLACGEGATGASTDPTGQPPEEEACCFDPPTDEHGNVVLPPNATDVQVGDEEENDNGRIVDRYAAHDTADDEWYENVDCPWSIGGDVPDVGGYLDLDGQLREAGFESTAGEIAGTLDAKSDALLAAVQRPDAAGMISHGRIGPRCPSRAVERAVAQRLRAVEQPRATSNAPAPPGNGACVDSRKLAGDAPFGGRDVIFVHGLDRDPINAKLAGSTAPRAEWPDDPAAFQQGGYWKQRANGYWQDHITRYLKGGNAAAPPTNRYLVVSWPSTQSLGHGVHAFLSQAAAAMATGAEVVPDASGDTHGFCAKGCVVQSHSTGGPLVSVALAVARLSRTLPFSAIGDVSWLPERVRAHVAYMGAFSGSHYATVAAWLGWLTAFTRPMCELADWVMTNALATQVSCSHTPVIAESVLTDLAVPIMQTVWRPLAALTPIPVLTVAGAHPSGMGDDESGAKPFSAVMKLLLHHGMDDGVLQMDSQCAAVGTWRQAPMSYTARPSVADAAANAGLLQSGLPPVISTRAYDMGINSTRAVRYYVDHVVGAQLGTPQFWAALALGPGGLQGHFAASMYRASAGCMRYLSPTGMVQPVLFRKHPGSSQQTRLPNHYSFLMAASDHRVGARGLFDTLCYEVTIGSGRSCTASTMNSEEVPAVDDRYVYTRGLVNWRFRDAIRESEKGKAIRFRIFGRRFKIWIWKRTYHRLDGWQQKIAPDYVYAYVLRP